MSSRTLSICIIFCILFGSLIFAILYFPDVEPITTTGIEQLYIPEKDLEKLLSDARQGDNLAYDRLVEYYAIYRWSEDDLDSRSKLIDLTRTGIRMKFKGARLLFLYAAQQGDVGCDEVEDVFMAMPMNERNSDLPEYASFCLRNNPDFRKTMSGRRFPN